jgi:hypothetical protein
MPCSKKFSFGSIGPVVYTVCGIVVKPPVPLLVGNMDVDFSEVLPVGDLVAGSSDVLSCCNVVAESSEVCLVVVDSTKLVPSFVTDPLSGCSLATRVEKPISSKKELCN